MNVLSISFPFFLVFEHCALSRSFTKQKSSFRLYFQGHAAKTVLTPILGDDWFTAELANDNAAHEMAYIAFQTAESGRLLDLILTLQVASHDVIRQAHNGDRSPEVVVECKLKCGYWKASTCRLLS